MTARYRVIGDFWGPCTAEVHGQPVSTVGFVTKNTEIEFTGEPGANLEPLNDEAKAAVKARAQKLAMLESEARTGKKAIDNEMLAVIGQVAAAAAAEAVKAALADLEPARRGPGRPRKEEVA